MNKVGTVMKRKGFKYTLVSAAIAAGTSATDAVLEQLSKFDIPLPRGFLFMVPAAVAAFMYGGGYTLCSLANLLSAEREIAAKGNLIELMEDVKEEHQDLHLEILWDRVFQYEAALRNDRAASAHEGERICACRRDLEEHLMALPDDCKKRLGLTEGNLDSLVAHIEAWNPYASGSMEGTKEGFIESARYALRMPIPQTLQAKIVGFDLSLLEDWYDGAVFVENDCKLLHQYYANNDILAVRNELGISLPERVFNFLFETKPCTLFRWTTAKISRITGVMISDFNQRYTRDTDPDYFNAEHFLWPNPDLDKDVEMEFGPGALEDLKRTRRKVMRKLFTGNQELYTGSQEIAHLHVYRMFCEDFLHAINTRLKYDVEFGAGILKIKPEDYFAEMRNLLGGFEHYRWFGADDLKHKATENYAAASAYIATKGLRLSPLERRSVLIGYHTNINNIQERIASGDRTALDEIKDIAKAERKYSQRLTNLRVHQELTRLQILTYMAIVDQLAEFDQPYRLEQALQVAS
jgi:hypothetical protein